MTYRNGYNTWDVALGGVPVETLDQMLAWLSVRDQPLAAQEAAVTQFLELNARLVPDDLWDALTGFLDGPGG